VFAVLVGTIALLHGCGETTGEGGSREAGFLAKLIGGEPEKVTVPAGTLLSIRFENSLSSHANQAGDGFTAVSVQEVSRDGETVLPDGARVSGRVTEARPAKIGGRARLSLSFDTLELPSGEALPIAATIAATGKNELPKDAAIIGGSTIGGAILGEAVDEGEGGIVGAIVGGLAGTAGAKATHGKPVVIPAGAVISLTLTSPVTVEVG
jgi:hypothetical protein